MEYNFDYYQKSTIRLLNIYYSAAHPTAVNLKFYFVKVYRWALSK
jgi:hypothetical protein